MENSEIVINRFFEQFFKHEKQSVFTDKTPENMMASPVNSDGWYSWQPIKGELQATDYTKIAEKFRIELPESFVKWHQLYFFLDCDCSIIRLPHSSPNEPLQEIIDNLDNGLAEELIAFKLYPFGQEGNDMGPLIFDGRNKFNANEFPIRVYDYDYNGDLEGLSDIIFSSFLKLLECLTYFLKETKKTSEIIPEFFKIDPEGAGKTGIDYWLAQAAMAKENEDFI